MGEARRCRVHGWRTTNDWTAANGNSCHASGMLAGVIGECQGWRWLRMLACRYQARLGDGDACGCSRRYSCDAYGRPRSWAIAILGYRLLQSCLGHTQPPFAPRRHPDTRYKLPGHVIPFPRVPILSRRSRHHHPSSTGCYHPWPPSSARRPARPSRTRSRSPSTTSSTRRALLTTTSRPSPLRSMPPISAT